MLGNLRQLRLFLAVAALGSPSRAAAACGVSQPAVSQALTRLEAQTGGALFDRARRGFFLTDRGRVFDGRLRGAMARLDAGLAEVAPRLVLTATLTQIRAVIALAAERNFTLAAQSLGLAQPSLHRSVTQVEREAGRALFERTPSGMVATRACRALVEAAELALSEFAQASAALAELDGREAGPIVIGALPLSRSALLPEALARFRKIRPTQPVTVIDGPYGEMLGGLRRGRIDLILGALRDPAPIGDVVQEALFDDRLCVLARPGHPLADRGDVPVDVLARQSWAVPRPGTPARAQFDALFGDRGVPPPAGILDCGSILLMREVLRRGDMLGCISLAQAEAEVANGLLVRVPTGITWQARPIGLTHRAGWMPTRAQALLVQILRNVAGGR